MDFTVIGDGVNLAARLESANKEYRWHIIVSASTLAELGERAQVRPLGSIVVKGKIVGVEILRAARAEPAGREAAVTGSQPSSGQDLFGTS